MTCWYQVWWKCDGCSVETADHPWGWAIYQRGSDGDDEKVDLCPKCVEAAGGASRVAF